jgi:hypothetical protein
MFRDPSTLRRHLNRKRPCAPVIDRDELSVEMAGKCHCRFCGRPYSSEWGVRRHMISCPIAARGERGLDALYSHVLEKTRRARERELAAFREAETLRAELAQTRHELALARGATVVTGDNATVVQMTCQTTNTVLNLTTNFVINIFGREETGHIATASVRDILAQCSGAVRADVAGGEAATQALVQAALLIYSDPDRPGNLTCYIPNKRDGNALVHGARGWEIIPVPLALSPMARKGLDLLFDKQPFEDTERYETALRVLRDHEERLVSTGAKLRTVLIRNKALLSRVLSQLPMAGERGHLKPTCADDGGLSA